MLTNFQLWVTLLVFLPLFALAPFFGSSGTETDIVSTVLGSVVLLFAAFQISVLFVLSRRGIVAAGSLVGTEIAGSDLRRAHRATYQFAFEGQQLTCKRVYFLERSVRPDVLVLIDSKRPKVAYILPGILGTARNSDLMPPARYSPDGRWQWTGTRWVAVDAVSPGPAPRDSLAAASLLLGVTSWIAACGGFGVLAADPNVVGGIAWQAPSPLLALAAVMTALVSMRSSARAATRVRGFATAGLVMGAVGVLLNAAYWIFAVALG